MLNLLYAECHVLITIKSIPIGVCYEFHYVECNYAEYSYANCHVLISAMSVLLD
jgi:hypothetical protein